MKSINCIKELIFSWPLWNQARAGDGIIYQNVAKPVVPVAPVPVPVPVPLPKPRPGSNPVFPGYNSNKYINSNNIYPSNQYPGNQFYGNQFPGNQYPGNINISPGHVNIARPNQPSISVGPNGVNINKNPRPIGFDHFYNNQG